MKKNFFSITCSSAFIASCIVISSCSNTKPEKPNVVFILADDLGWMDVQYMGSKLYETPNIDALASEGMRFMNAYSANALCSPTRASIMTGFYPARVGIITPSCHVDEEIFEQKVPETGPPNVKVLIPNSITRLTHDYYTLAEAMRDAGYVTGHFGKWHLGKKPYDALHHGFDVDIPNSPVPGPVGGYFSPWVFWETDGPDGEYIEDRMASEAVKFIKENKEKPFFLNYWAFSTHAPIDAKREVSGKYYHKLKKLGPDYPQQNAPYAAKVEGLDDAVGELVASLKREGVYENTIIIFFSDNGGLAIPTKETQTLYWNTPVTNNFPLRQGKGSMYEGGTRVPMVVIWPGVTKPGSVSNELVSSIDWFPTILDMLGLPNSKNVNFDGISIVPAFKGESLPRESVFTFKPYKLWGEFPGVSVRKGDYKLIRFFYGGEGWKNAYELYNLAEDPGEENNLADEKPQMVSELDSLISGFLTGTNAVLPVPNPDYKPGSN